MNNLIAGYKRFRAKGWPERRQAFEALAEDGQHPDTLVIACVDSRADPGMIFDAAPGQMLVVRNVAALVPPYQPDKAYHGTSAAVEFAVRVMKVPHIVVMGHGLCGGVHALLNGTPAAGQDFIAPWMSMADQARHKVHHIQDPMEKRHACEREVVKESLTNLMTFPWVAGGVQDGSLRLHGAWFAIHSGLLEIMQPDGTFKPVPDSIEDAA